MKSPLMLRALASASLALAAVMLATGCDSPPQGQAGGRRDPYRTYPSESSSALPLPAALMESSDLAAEQFAQELARLPQTRDQRIIVVIGDINNSTGNVPTSELEMIRSRVRNHLLQSDYVRSKVRFVENRARMSRIAERERVAQGGYYADPADYDPAITYVLNMDVYRMSRGRVHQYYLEFMLSHFATNEIAIAPVRYDLKQEQ